MINEGERNSSSFERRAMLSSRAVSSRWSGVVALYTKATGVSAGMPWACSWAAMISSAVSPM